MSVSKTLLKQVVYEQNKYSRRKLRRYVVRDIEDKLVKSIKTTDFITVITGIRRSGKSTLLNRLRVKYFKPSYYINFDDERLVGFRVSDFQTLLEVFLELYGKSKYVFLDEVQNINGWERFVNRLREQGYKVVVTGSNSRLLSKEFGTFLTGRYVSFTVFPFSFKEFLRFKKVNIKDIQQQLKNKLTTELKVKLTKYFTEYLKWGGFPEFLKTRNIEFLQELYKSIIYKDIITRYDIKSEVVLRQITQFALSNIAKRISFRSFKSFGVRSSTTISQYFDYLTNVYLFFLVPKFAFSVRSQLLARKKLYVIDNALARYIGFRPTLDEGRFLENTVFLHLVQRFGKESIYYYSTNGKSSKEYECDFVVVNNTLDLRSVTLYQVTATLSDRNYEREMQGLIRAYQFFKEAGYKVEGLYIVTLEQYDNINLTQNTQDIHIHVLPIWDFLL